MRGILDTVPETVLAHLLEHLPQDTPHTDWMPAELLDSTRLGKLETEDFTGFASFAIQPDWLGGLLFYHGSPIEAWRRALGGIENRAEAYRNLLAFAPHAEVRLFKLPVSLVPCVAALSVGAEPQSYHAAQVSPSQMQQQLEGRLFSGVAVLEHGQTGQVWFYQKGKCIYGPSLPETFAEGRLHLVAMPDQVPQNVADLAQTEARAEQKSQLEMQIRLLEQLLRQQVGDNSDELLQSNPQFFKETDPKRLETQIEIWLEDNFGAALLGQFRDGIGKT
jgi:hypothetical protein